MRKFVAIAILSCLFSSLGMAAPSSSSGPTDQELLTTDNPNDNSSASPDSSSPSGSNNGNCGGDDGSDEDVE